MKTIFLDRAADQRIQTSGILTTIGFTAKSLELPWKENASNTSCIPANTSELPFYLCKWTRSPRMSREGLERWLKKNPTLTEVDCPDVVKNVFTYEIFGVPDRAGIRIHPANYASQLLGCIALGDETKDLNLDGQNDILHSGDTCKKFNEFMNKEDFKLYIRNAA